MRRGRGHKIALALILILALLLVPLKSSRVQREHPPVHTLRCLISVRPSSLHQSLVGKYAQDHRLSLDIRKGEATPDSLLSGAIDLWICPAPDSLPEGVVASRCYADSTVWMVRAEEMEALIRINRWLGELTSTKKFTQLEKNYLKGEPVSLDKLSDYDKSIRRHAEAIGWDWRLVASVIYHESRFHIAANSDKGAVGLMQIRSARYTDEEMLDPEANLQTGTRYLARLLAMFKPISANDMEAVKFTLAAYNMGEGRVLAWKESARQQGLDDRWWDQVCSLLPRGHHTRAYVENVLNTYAEYSKIYPR